VFFDRPGHLLAHPHRSRGLAGTRTQEIVMNRIRFHIRPALIVAGVAEENQIMTAVTACAPCGSAREDPGQRCDEPVVIDLVARARGGDIRAWDALVERYAPLIWSICRRYRLGRADAEDVGQSVWLCLVDDLGKIRQPAALPGWLATTTRRECGRVVRAARGPHAGLYPLDAETIPDEQAGTAEQDLLAAERHAALRQAFASLPPHGQQLIALLAADPPVPYTQISARLGIPIGSIGPTRRRFLHRMRHHPAITALTDAQPGPRGPVLAAAS
jgi:RNA polymerase sigma factor (sigma-70 family)